MTPLLSIRNLSKQYADGLHRVDAVRDFSLDIHAGEVVGIAGESGCGKSTLGKLIVRLLEPSGGSIMFRGTDLLSLPPSAMRRMRQKAQIVLQDPYGSLNPLLTVKDIISEGLNIQSIADDGRINEVLEAMDLPSSFLKRRPHELSGGQRQRVNIARALVLKPDFIVFDESVSALDVSHQRQILTLLKRLQKEWSLTYLFISHDLGVLKAISDRIGIMYRGNLVELGKAEQVISEARHPYTQALVSAIPIPDPTEERVRRRLILAGDPPAATQRISGCQFHPRCPRAMPLCCREAPALVNEVACHFAVRE